MKENSSRVDLFLMVNSKYFEANHLMEIKERLNDLNDQQWNMLMTAQFKDPFVILIISILAGTFGIDRFMLGEVGLGIAKLLTCGGFGIWHIIDLFIIMGNTREHNYQRFNDIMQMTYIR